MQSSEVGRSLACSSRKEAHVSRIGAWSGGLGRGGGGKCSQSRRQRTDPMGPCGLETGATSVRSTYSGSPWNVLSWGGPWSDLNLIEPLQLLCREQVKGDRSRSTWEGRRHHNGYEYLIPTSLERRRQNVALKGRLSKDKWKSQCRSNPARKWLDQPSRVSFTIQQTYIKYLLYTRQWGIRQGQDVILEVVPGQQERQGRQMTLGTDSHWTT